MSVKVICIYPPPGSIKLGAGVDRHGERWEWEFHDWLGPLFVDTDGEPLVWQPGDDSPAWEPFEAWLASRVWSNPSGGSQGGD